MPVADTLREVIVRASNEGRGGLGAVVVFAAGNEDRVILDDELAAIPEVLAVTAMDRYDNPVPYTNTGASVDIAAPSATVSTTIEGGYTQQFGGTSAAAPVVSGIAGLILSMKPELTGAEVRQLLIDSAKKDGRVTFDENGHHNTYGFGLLSPEGIVNIWYPPEQEPEPEPEPSPEPEQPASEEGGCQASQSSIFMMLLSGVWLLRRLKV